VKYCHGLSILYHHSDQTSSSRKGYCRRECRLALLGIGQIAEAAGPERKWTLGALTNPDLVDRGAESNVTIASSAQTMTDSTELIGILMNDDRQAQLGHVIVYDRIQSKLGNSMHERHAKEATSFDNAPPKTLPRQQAGIGALKQRLSGLLVGGTRIHQTAHRI